MAKIATFFNLPFDALGTDTETNNRIQDIEGQLSGHTFVHANGGAENACLRSIARTFVLNNLDARVFVATCWPTEDALRQWVGNTPSGNMQSIVVAGLVDDGNQTYPAPPLVTGLKSFDPNVLPPSWPALLAKVSPGLTKWGIVCDGDATRVGMAHQVTMIQQSLGASVTPILIHTEDMTKQSPTNPNFEGDLQSFFQSIGNNPAGLIVTAGTRSTMLRNIIISAVKTQNNTAGAGKVFAIFPASFPMDNADALISYGPNLRTIYKTAASTYVKAILNGGPAQKLDMNTTYECLLSRTAARDVNLNTGNISPITITVGTTSITIPVNLVH